MATFSVKTSDHYGLIRSTTGSRDIAVLMLCADSLLSPILLCRGIKFGPDTAAPWMQSMQEVNTDFIRKRDTAPQKEPSRRMAMIHFRKENRKEVTVEFRVVIPKTPGFPCAFRLHESEAHQISQI